MNNLEKAKEYAAERAREAAQSIAKEEARSAHEKSGIKEAKDEIHRQLTSYEGVKTQLGVMTWHPEKLELRIDGDPVLKISIGWERDVLVFNDDDGNKFYNDLPSIDANFMGVCQNIQEPARWARGLSPRLESHYIESFLKTIAERISYIL